MIKVKTAPNRAVPKGKQSAGIEDTELCGDLSFAAAEAYKMLRTSLQYSFPNSGACKVIGVTSAEKGEGKSTLSINLAYMLSHDKKKVLLLEGDMRLPTFSKRLGLNAYPGLSDYLTGFVTNNESLQHSEKAPHVAVITAGVTPPNPSELLGSLAMERFLVMLKQYYDYIILDLPPVNIVSDALAVSQYVDGFLFTVRGNYSTRQSVKAAIEKLKLVDTHIIGFVLNTDEVSAGKYGKYKRYGDSNGYGSYEKAAKRNIGKDLFSEPKQRDKK